MPSEKIQRAFDTAAKVVIGSPVGGLSGLSTWLASGNPRWREVARKGQTLLIPYYGAFISLAEAKARLLSENGETGSVRLALKTDIAGLAGEMKTKGAYVVDYAEGVNRDVERSSTYKNISCAFSCLGCYDSKNIAFNSWSDFNNYTFGCHRLFYSDFCIKCYHSNHLQRCFEMDSCNKCADCHFCHNCEGLQDCMFCFNVNNLRYAVANVVVGKEKYEALKRELLSRVISELKEKSACTLSIYGF
jgi:hypothetical protein